MSMNMPKSNALSEADPASPQELFARDPERFSDRDIDAIILYMRDLRIRIEASGAIAAKTRVKKEKVSVSVSSMFGDDDDE